MEGFVQKSYAPTTEPEINVTKREVTSYKAIFGNVDRVREIVMPGAFAKSIGPGSRLAKGQVTVRHNHKDLVGKMLHAQEDGVGLLTVDKYASDPVSDRVFGMVRDGIIGTSSFTAKYRSDSRIKAKGADGQPVYQLTALELIEAGPADPDFAVNPETRVVAVKGLSEVASALSAMASMEGAEAWTMDRLKELSPDERDALLAVLSMLPVGMSVENMIGELRGDDAAMLAEQTGKCLQLSEAIDAWMLREAAEQIRKFNPRGRAN